MMIPAGQPHPNASDAVATDRTVMGFQVFQLRGIDVVWSAPTHTMVYSMYASALRAKVQNVALPELIETLQEAKAVLTMRGTRYPSDAATLGRINDVLSKVVGIPDEKKR